MAVSVVWAMNATCEETLSGSTVPAIASGSPLRHSNYNAGATINASSTPPATKWCAVSQAMSGGSATVDLTSIQGTQGTQSLSGLKVQIFKAKAPLTNGATITLAEGASNGYELAGNTWKVALAPGQQFMFYGNDATPDVGGSAKTIDLTGTTTDAVELAVVAG